MYGHRSARASGGKTLGKDGGAAGNGWGFFAVTYNQKFHL